MNGLPENLTVRTELLVLGIAAVAVGCFYIGKGFEAQRTLDFVQRMKTAADERRKTPPGAGGPAEGMSA